MEKNTIYLIKQVDFDNTNQVEPRYERCKGYKKTQDDADSYVTKLQRTTPKYWGWDHHQYPQFYFCLINEIMD